jgi:DNA ligase-1
MLLSGLRFGLVPDFEAMMERFQSKQSEHTIQYCVFDVIYHNGQKVTQLPLHERKELLDKIVQWAGGSNS